MRTILSVVVAAAPLALLLSCSEHAKTVQGNSAELTGPIVVARVVDSGTYGYPGRPGGIVLVLWSDHVVAISTAFPDGAKTYRFAHVDDEAYSMIEDSIETAASRCGGQALVGPDMTYYDCATGGTSVAVPRAALENPKNWNGASCARSINQVLEGVPKIPSDDTVTAEEQSRRLATLPKRGILTADAWRPLE